MNTLEISKNKLQEIHKAEEYFNALATNIQLSGCEFESHHCLICSRKRRKINHFN